jgi:hypothetical protein
MPRSVAIVFEEDFSGQLEKLSFHTPVWLVDTPENRAAAEAAWHKGVEWPHIAVTLFRAPAALPTREEWRSLVEQITLHERAVEGVDVFGAALSAIAHAVLVEAGFGRFEETPGGFRARL